MKNHLILLIILLSLASSCISLKTVDDINRYHIVEGKKKNNNPKPPNLFTFQTDKDKSLFLSYLRDRYDYVKGFSPENFTTKIKDVDFFVNVLSDEESSTYVDFTELIFNKDNPELVRNGKVKRFISIVVTDTNGEDALASNSFYRNVVVNYLDDLRTSFKAY